MKNLITAVISVIALHVLPVDGFAKEAQSTTDTYDGLEVQDWEYQFKNDWFYSKRQPRFELKVGKKYVITYKNVTVMLPNEEGASKTQVKQIVDIKPAN
jgi:hypothetical protein